MACSKANTRMNVTMGSLNYLIDQGIEKLTAFKIMEFVRKGKPTKEVEQIGRAHV